MTNETAGTEIANTVSSGDINAVVQAAVINGGVALHHVCPPPHVAFIYAAGALTAPSYTMRSAGLHVLEMLAGSTVEMFGAVVDLVFDWCEDLDAREQNLWSGRVWGIVDAGIRQLLASNALELPLPDDHPLYNVTDAWLEDQVPVAIR